MFNAVLSLRSLSKYKMYRSGLLLSSNVHRIPRLYRNYAAAEILDSLEVEQNVRGRVDCDQYQNIIDHLLKNGEPISHEQSLLLLESCGDTMFTGTPEYRCKLVEKTWNLLPSLGITPSVKHYNALLSVWVQNKYRFPVVDVLSKMESGSDKILPDSTTFQYILTRYCLDGDAEGANTILEHMKNKGFTIDENVFNALVYCYSKRGDKEAVNNVLKAMSAAGLTPTSSTYFQMALPLAEIGDIEGIKRVDEEASNADYFGINERDWFEIIYTLCANGQSSKLSQLLELLPRIPSPLFKAHNAALRLILLGKYEDAFRVACSSLKEEHSDESEEYKAAFVVFTLMAMKVPVDVVHGFFQYLKSHKLMERPYHRALFSALKHYDDKNALRIIRYLHQQENTRMRMSFFYPILVHYSKTRTAPEIVSFIFQLRTEFGLSLHHWEILEFLLRAMPNETSEEFVSAVRQKLHSNPQQLSYGISLIQEYMQFKRIPVDIEQIKAEFGQEEEQEPGIGTVSVQDLDSLPLNEETSVDELLNYLRRTRESGGNEKVVLKRLILAYCARNEVTKAEDAYKDYVNAGGSIRSTFLDELMQVYQNVKDPSDKLTEFMKKIGKEAGVTSIINSARQRRQQVETRPTEPTVEMLLEEMTSVDELLDYLRRTRESGGNEKVVLKRLILTYCSQNDVTKAEETYKDYVNAGGSIRSTFVDELLHVYQNVEDPSDKLTKFMKKIGKEAGVTSIGRRRQQVQSTVEMLLEKEDLTVKDLEENIVTMKQQGLNHKAALRRLLHMYSKNGDTVGLLKTVRELESAGSELPNAVLQPLVVGASLLSTSGSQELDFAENVLLKLIGSSELVNIACLLPSLVRDGQSQAAVYLMQFMERYKPFSMLSINGRAMKSIGLFIEDALTDLKNSNGTDHANVITEIAIRIGFMKPSKKVIEELVYGAIDRNDLSHAVNIFINAVKSASLSGGVQRLMTELIRRVDAKLLQQVFNHQQKISGETDAKFRLAMALCNCGKMEQAQKVWNTIETPIGESSTNEEFDVYTNPKAYVNLAKVCRDSSINLLDRNRVYLALYNIYRKRKDWKSAIQAWADVENDKKLLPSVDLYRLYARILREGDRPVPPEIELSTVSSAHSFADAAKWSA